MADPPLLFVLSGPGGVGKGTVAKALVEEVDDLWLSRSWTTRDPRAGEAADAYEFVTRGEFIEKIEADGFFEYAEFLGNYYGTPIVDPPEGSDILLEIDVQGARQIQAKRPDAHLLFLDAPSREEQLARLTARGDSPEKIQERIDKADRELTAGQELGAEIIINDNLTDTVAQLAALIAEHRAERSTAASTNHR